MQNRRDFIRKTAMGTLAIAFANNMDAAVSMPSPQLLDSDEEKFWKLIRNQFPLSKEKIYLNNGTMGPSPYPVINAVHEAMRDNDIQGNYGGWEKTADKIAGFVGALPDEIALTHNVTDGINIVAWGVPLKKGDEVILTTHEHVGNATPWLNRAKLDGIVIKVFTPAKTAAETLQRINDVLTKKTKVIAVPHIPCTIGQILPIKEICKLAKDKNIFSCIDGAHGPGMLKLDLHDMGCDFYTTCTHKWLLGPKGTGFLYVRKDMLDTLQTLFVGGGSDTGWDMLKTPPTYSPYAATAHRYYYGTQNVALYRGVDAAIDFMNYIGMDRVEKRSRGLATQLQNKLLAIGDKIEMLTPTEDASRGAVVGFRIKGVVYTDFYNLAAKNDIRIRSVAENGLNSLRVSTHIYNNMDEVDKLVELVKGV
ncbi:MAG: aminotransferase class V-fold PLP-dependent enzyme [Bacteroidota bacterium]|nr:aminotransferase class V-fold PLP-dependent enzyme [Bacteroidota bacterium]